MHDKIKKYPVTDRKAAYTDADRFLEYLFKSANRDAIDRVIELARKKSYDK